MLAISLVLKAGYSAFKSTMKRLMAGGNRLPLAFSVENRLSMPYSPKASAIAVMVSSPTSMLPATAYPSPVRCPFPGVRLGARVGRRVPLPVHGDDLPHLCG